MHRVKLFIAEQAEELWWTAKLVGVFILSGLALTGIAYLLAFFSK